LTSVSVLFPGADSKIVLLVVRSVVVVLVLLFLVFGWMGGRVGGGGLSTCSL